MKFLAQLNQNNIVLNISIADESWDSTGWIEYTEENPAIIGGDYFDGYFYSPQPFPSWTRQKGNWICPKPQPSEGLWFWDESKLDWVAVDPQP